MCNNGDADLYTRYDAEPTTSKFDCRPYDSDSNETCFSANPEQGNWYIGVRTYQTFSNLTLSVEYETGTSSSDQTYTVTAVRDNLDNTDLYDMADELEALGYAQSTMDIDVSTNELISYLQQQTTTHYHTGHGSSGYVATSDGGLETSDMIPGRINVRNTIWATCLTMSDRSWRDTFSDNTETISGYTNYSWDYTDEEVVKDFGTYLGQGNTYTMAWYLANLPHNNLNDRWFVYSREGNKIIEYSADSGNEPTRFQASFVTMDQAGKLKAADDILQNRNDYSRAFGRMRMLPAQKTTKVDSAGWQKLKRTTMKRSDAITKGELHLNSIGEMKRGMKLNKSFSIKSRQQDSAPFETVGWVMRYTMQAEDGLQVRGNSMDPNKTLTVTEDGEIMASIIHWPQIITEKYSETYHGLLTPAEALQEAAEAISMRVKKGPLENISCETGLRCNRFHVRGTATCTVICVCHKQWFFYHCRCLNG